jgi:hypothetical protein
MPCFVPDSGWCPGIVHSISSASTDAIPSRSPAVRSEE